MKDIKEFMAESFQNIEEANDETRAYAQQILKKDANLIKKAVDNLNNGLEQILGEVQLPLNEKSTNLLWWHLWEWGDFVKQTYSGMCFYAHPSNNLKQMEGNYMENKMRIKKFESPYDTVEAIKESAKYAIDNGNKRPSWMSSPSDSIRNVINGNIEDANHVLDEIGINAQFIDINQILKKYKIKKKDIR